MKIQWDTATSNQVLLSATGTGGDSGTFTSGAWNAKILVNVGVETPDAPVLTLKVQLSYAGISTASIGAPSDTPFPRQSVILELAPMPNTPGEDIPTGVFSNWAGVAKLEKDASQPDSAFPFDDWHWKLTVSASGDQLPPTPPSGLRIVQ